MPFIFLGIILVIFVAGIILFSYLLILGAIIGLVLFLINWLREKFFVKQRSVSTTTRPAGRIIDHE